MSMRSFILLLLLAAGAAYADSTTVPISAVVLSKNNCKFNSGTANLAFGNLNPASGSDVTATATIAFRCVGSAPLASFAFSHDSGLAETAPGAPRMRHATLTQYLPYSLALSPSSGTIPKNVWQTLTITGVVSVIDYQDASMGAYTDTVVITLNP